MSKPKFSTLLLQAKEQCQKQYDKYDMYSFGNIIIKFFASGMEYRLSHEHVVAERTFLSSYNQEEFLLGYLQGKGADVEMLELLEGECLSRRNGTSDGISRLTDYFTDGLFYEESILEPNNHTLD